MVTVYLSGGAVASFKEGEKLQEGKVALFGTNDMAVLVLDKDGN